MIFLARMTHLFLFAALSVVSSAAQTLSYNAVTIPAGYLPMAVHLADFNGDSQLDIAVINGGLQGTVSVLLNEGGGNFSSPRTTSTGGLLPWALQPGDFNHDGQPDLAVVNHTSNNVSILLGNGDGTFRFYGSAGVHLGPVAITGGDFNRDGNPDLAVVNSVSGDVSILLGNRDGSFRAGSSVFVGSAPTSVKAGDFNGDGQPDLAVSNGTLGQQLIEVFLGNGDGTFRTGGSATVGYEPFALVMHDFNRDGKPDLAVVNLASNDLSVLMGNGDGTFQPAAAYSAGKGPVGIQLGDFNRDGKADLAVCSDVSAEILLFLGHGDGTFHAPLSYPVATMCNSVAVGDLTQDGRLDVVTATPDGVVMLVRVPTGGS